MDTADRLIESAQELLWERGYVGTSPKAIQERAGAGQGSMYHHFRGKPDLALTALRRSAGQLRSLIQAQLDEGDTSLAKVGAYLLRERDPLRGCRVGRMTMDPEVIASDELRQPVHETLTWLRDQLAAVISDGIATGELRPGLDPEDTAAAITAVVQGGYVLARAAGSREPFDQAVRGAFGMLTAAAGPGGAGGTETAGQVGAPDTAEAAGAADRNLGWD